MSTSVTTTLTVRVVILGVVIKFIHFADALWYEKHNQKNLIPYRSVFLSSGIMEWIKTTDTDAEIISWNLFACIRFEV